MKPGQILAKYNIMGLGLGLGVAAMAQMRGVQQQPSVLQQQQAQNTMAGQLLEKGLEN